jgi:serine/threonine protein kinase
MPAVLTDRPVRRRFADDLYATALIDGPLTIHRPKDASDPVDQAYSEYKDLCAAGVEMDPDAFCARFPAYQTSLRRLLELHRELEDNPDLLKKLDRWPEPGQQFFGFELEQELGRGAFARVFLAREPNVGNRQVVVKVSSHADDEADTLGKFRHPNVVPIHSARYDETTGFSVVCMPFLGGTTLLPVVDGISANRKLPERAEALLAAAKDDRWPADSAAPPAAALRRGRYLDGVLYLGERLANALAYVHERGVLHRDLKPSNILVCPNGEPVLIDFNLAHDRSLTEYRLGGTLPYMPPEQLEAMSRQRLGEQVGSDNRADLFALGVILYELLTGAHPFGPVPLKLKTAAAREFLLSRQKRGPRPLRGHNRQIDPAVESLILRCLSSDPARRPASARELEAELRRLQSPLRRARRWVANHARTVAAAALLLATGGTALGGYIANLPSADAAHRQAGLSLFHDGKYQEAIAQFTRSLEVNPNQPDVRIDRGRANSRVRDWASAAADFKAADPDHNGRAAACLGYCYLLERQPKEAITWFKKALQNGIETAAVYNDLAFSLVRSEKLVNSDEEEKILREAEEAANNALDRSPGFMAAHYNRASARFRLWFTNHDPAYALGAFEDYRDVVNQGVATANCYFFAAESCAAVLGTRPGNAQDDPLYEVGKQYLMFAVEKGYPRDNLEAACSRTKCRAEWARDLPPNLKTIVTHNGTEDNLRLIDPVVD